MPSLILTEDAPAYGVLAALRALRASGHETWLAVAGPGTYGARSRARAGTLRVPAPTADADGYVRSLADAAERLSVAAVLPGTENALLALAGREDAFPDGVALGVCSRETVWCATDKAALAELAAEAGLETPPTVAVDGSEGEPPDVRYPVVVKPLRSAGGGRGEAAPGPRVERVETPDELRNVLASGSVDRWLVQPYFAGDLYAVCGVAWEGKVVTAMHQLTHRISPPFCGGSAYAVAVPADEELERAVGRLVSLIGWSGLFQAQFLRSPGRAFLIDFNPRIYGTLALAAASGLNLPAIWVSLLLGGRPSVDGYRVGARFRSEERDGLALLTAMAQGRWRSAVAGLRPRRRTVHAAFSLRDPLPLLTSVAKLRRLTEVWGAVEHGSTTATRRGLKTRG